MTNTKTYVVRIGPGDEVDALSGLGQCLQIPPMRTSWFKVTMHVHPFYLCAWVGDLG